jgi:ABC-type glycerol-3-phosphate transport system substrate-binding protein
MFHLTYNPATGQAGDSLWGLPRDVSTFALYLNLDLLEEAGVEDPRELAARGEWNWDTFLATAIAVDALGDDITVTVKTHGGGRMATGSTPLVVVSSTKTAPPAPWTRPNP